VLDRVDVAGYDSIVVAGSDRLPSGEESDARTLMAYLLLRDILPEKNGPAVLVELLDAANVPLIRRRDTEVLVSPLVLSHMLAQVALRRELRAVFDELFGPGGAEIVFRPATGYGIAGQAVSFRAIEAAAAAHGDIAIGVRSHANGHAAVLLNPSRSQEWTLAAGDEIIALAGGS
jgi:ion channel POLLUX/CASTOR